ncbi:hypothetical protein QLX67_01590 [Balneolaceae bacterium ANBcel3]|nr:hypothetical protein [Balneolaceae bacterium ANBcel3]
MLFQRAGVFLLWAIVAGGILTTAGTGRPMPGVLPDDGDTLSVQEDARKHINFKEIRERFTFDVRYGLLNLGRVYVYIQSDTLYNETPAIHVVTEMVANRRLPLMSNRVVHYHSLLAFEDSIPYGLKFWQNSLHRNLEERYVYEFDYEAGHVLSLEEGALLDTLELHEKADAGPAIFYYARLFAGTDQETRYPVYIDNQASEVFMTFSSETESYDSPAFPGEEIMAYTMDGFADFDGPFGFSGDFQAVFKSDEFRIPLEARVRIFLGSVRVRLIEYERLTE